MKHFILFSLFSFSLSAYCQISSITNYAYHGLMWELAYDGEAVWTTSDAGLLKWNLEDMSHEIYTTKEGLLDAVVFDIAVDNNQQLWLGTDKGIAVWKDNVLIDHITQANGLPIDNIIDIELDGNENLWVATYGGGIARRDVGGLWTYWSTANGLPSDYISDLAIDAWGNVWAGTGTGVPSNGHLIKIGLGDLVTLYGADYGLSGSLQKLTIDTDGSVWFGTYGDGAGRFNPTLEETTFYAAEAGIVLPDIAKVVIDGNDTKWFVQSKINSNIGGLYRYEGATQTTEFENWGNMSAPTSALALEDQIFVTTRDGLVIFDQTSETYSAPYIPNQLNDNTITSIAVSDEGKTVVGTLNGLNIKEGEEWTYKSHLNGLQGKHIRDVEVDAAGNFWVGLTGGSANGGFSFMNINGFCTQYNSFSSNITSDRVMEIFIDNDGNRWFGGEVATGAGSIPDGRIAIWNTDNSWETIDESIGLVNDDIQIIEQDPFGKIWVGTEDGLSIIGLGSEILNITNYQKINDIDFDTQGNTWLVVGEDFESYNTAIDGKLVKIDSDLNTTDYEQFTQDGDVHDFTAVFVDEQDQVWAGTLQGGLFMFDGNTWQQFTSYDGLASNTITYLVGASNNELWVGTTRGISVLTLETEVNIEPIDLESLGINVYPNPAQNQLFIESKIPLESIRIFDSQAKQLQIPYSNHLFKQSIDISALRSGLYYFAIASHNGKNISGKWVKD